MSLQRQRSCLTHDLDLFLILDYERRVNELVQCEPLKLGQIEKLSSQLNTYIIPMNQSKSKRCALIFYNTEDCEGAGFKGKASTTLSLDLCPSASPQFTGPWNRDAVPLKVITRKLLPFYTSLLFNVKWDIPHLNFDFSTLIPTKIGKNCCEMEMRPAPPHFQRNLDTDLNSKLCWSKVNAGKVTIMYK